MANDAGQQARAAALKAKQNPTTTQAANPAPVSEIVPTQATDTTPTTPTQATDKQAQAWNKMDVAKQQAFLKANTGFDPTSLGLTKKTDNTPATNLDTKTSPVKGIKLETPKEQVTQAPDYADKETQRLQEIKSNLEQYYTQDQAQFKNRGTFDKNFKYYDRTQEQKDVLDQFYNQKKTERDITGKTAAQLAKDGTDVDSLKVTDPNFYNEIQAEKNKLAQQQTNTNLLATVATQSGFPGFDKLIDKLELKIEGFKGIEEYPEIKEAKDKITGYDTQLTTLQDTLDKIRKEVISQYPGVPSSQIDAIVTDRSSKIYEEMNTLTKLKNADTSYANNRVDIYNLQKDETAKQIADFSSLYGLYQESPEGIAETALAKWKAENPNMDTGTPEQQEMAVNQTLAGYYETYGNIIQRPQAQVMREVMAYAKAKGIPVSQALKENFLDPLMAKPQFKQMQQKALGISRNIEKLTDTTWLEQQADGSWKFMSSDGSKASSEGNGTGVSREQQIADIKSTIESAVSAPAGVAQISDGIDGGQCGYFSNNISQALGAGKLFGDSLASKTNQINSQTAQAGSFIVMTSATKAGNGHVGYVTSVNSDGTITIKDSNWSGDSKVQSHDISINDPRIKGYVSMVGKVKPMSGTEDQGPTALGGITAEAGNAYRKLLNTKAIAGASKLSDAERENMKVSMDEAIKQGDSVYANEILRGVILGDTRVGTPIYDNQQLKAGLGLVRDTLQSFKESGGDTGVLRAMAEKAANYLGTTTDVQLAKAKNQLGVLVADYIRAISGTAASDVEVQRLINNMPNIKNVDSFNMTLLDNLENIADTKMKSNLELFLGGYKDIAPELFPELYKKSNPL